MSLENIGNIILKNTSISESELSTLFATENDAGVKIGEHLSQSEFSTADELLMGLCKAMRVDFIKDIPINDISVDLVRNIPINYAKNHEILPFKEDNGIIRILTTNPLNYKVLDDLRAIFNKPTKALVTTSGRVQDAINKVYEKSTAALEGLDEIEDEDYDLDEPIIDLLEAGDDEAPVIKLVNTLLFRAVKEKASDIHVEPYERDMVVRFRIDGVL